MSLVQLFILLDGLKFAVFSINNLYTKFQETCGKLRLETQLGIFSEVRVSISSNGMRLEGNFHYAGNACRFNLLTV